MPVPCLIPGSVYILTPFTCFALPSDNNQSVPCFCGFHIQVKSGEPLQLPLRYVNKVLIQVNVGRNSCLKQVRFSCDPGMLSQVLWTLHLCSTFLTSFSCLHQDFESLYLRWSCYSVHGQVCRPSLRILFSESTTSHSLI